MIENSDLYAHLTHIDPLFREHVVYYVRKVKGPEYLQDAFQHASRILNGTAPAITITDLYGLTVAAAIQQLQSLREV